VIKEIKILMLEEAQEAVSKRKSIRGEPATRTGKWKKKQQQRKVEDGQGKVWDPGGSQQHSRGSHE
jgi:hypothetical protein